MRVITAGGKGAANDRRRHMTDRGGRVLLGGLLFLGLGLGDVLNLFLHRGEQIELKCLGNLRRYRNSGLSARRLLVLLIYL